MTIAWNGQKKRVHIVNLKYNVLDNQKVEKGVLHACNILVECCSPFF